MRSSIAFSSSGGTCVLLLETPSNIYWIIELNLEQIAGLTYEDFGLDFMQIASLKYRGFGSRIHSLDYSERGYVLGIRMMYVESRQPFIRLIVTSLNSR